MNRNHKILAASIVVVTMLTLTLASCASSATNKQGDTNKNKFANRPKTILWVQPMKNHPVHRLMQAGFFAECKKLGYRCTVVGYASATVFDEAATMPLVDAALASKKYGAVAVYPMSPPLTALATKLGNKGYPIVGWHAIPAKGSVPGLLASAAQFVPAAGTAPAKAICAQAGGKGTVAITEGSLNPEENLKASSFRTELATSCPGMKTTAIGIEGFDSAKAIALAVGMLSADPTVVAAYSTTGNGAQTWSLAAAQANRKLTIIGMDYIRQNLDLIAAGKVYGVVGQPLFQESAAVVDILDAILKGKKYVYSNIIPSTIVTKANIATYYAILKKAGQ
jgi:ribose transport system substrate-binding protein